MVLRKNMFRVGNRLKEEITNMEAYLIFLDRLSEIDMSLVRSRTQEHFQFIEDTEKSIKDSFEEYMKFLADEKARVKKL